MTPVTEAEIAAAMEPLSNIGRWNTIARAESMQSLIGRLRDELAEEKRKSAKWERACETMLKHTTQLEEYVKELEIDCGINTGKECNTPMPQVTTTKVTFKR